MKTQKKSASGNVHFLNSAFSGPSPREKAIEAMFGKLGQRLDRIEKDFNRHAARLEQRLKVSTPVKAGDTQELREEFLELRKHFDSQVEDILTGLKVPAKLEPKPRKSSGWLSLLDKLSPKYWLPNRAPQDLLLEDVDAFGRDPEFENKLRPFFDFLYQKYWRVSVEGIENLPVRGRGLLVSNHSGTLPYDGSMIRMSVTNEHPAQRDVRFLVEDFVYYLPFIGTYMYRIGGVRASQENAERLLNNDHLVAVFPEGVKGIGKYFKERYHLQRFGRGGFIKLAIKTGSPIIPVAVIGAEEIHPILYKSSLLAKPLGIPYVPITPTLPLLGPLGLIPFPTKWSIQFGKPIDVTKYGTKALDDELKIHQLSEQIRQTIQRMIADGLRRRRSVWFG